MPILYRPTLYHVERCDLIMMEKPFTFTESGRELRCPGSRCPTPPSTRWSTAKDGVQDWNHGQRRRERHVAHGVGVDLRRELPVQGQRPRRRLG